MKRLHKKIGVGVLVAGVVLGAGGLSGGSLAHAYEISDVEIANIYKNSILESSALKYDDIRKLDFPQISVLSRLCRQSNAFRGKGFDVIDVRNMAKEGSGIKLEERSRYIDKKIFSRDSEGLESLREIVSKLPRGSFVKIQFLESLLEVAVIVL